MKNEVISKFKEKPKTKAAWWAMGLGLGAFFVPLMLGTFTTIIRPIIDPASMVGRESSGIVGATMGFSSGVVALILSVSTIITGVRAYKKGEQSWVLWVGFVPAILVGAFWVFMIISEFIFPH